MKGSVKFFSEGSVVMAVDPGKGTGLAWCDLSAVDDGLMRKGSETVDWGKLVWTEEITPMSVRKESGHGWPDEVEVTYAILTRMLRLGVKVLVVESFALNPRRTLTDEALWPVRLISQLEFALSYKWWQGTLVYQPPSMKSTATDERLKKLGLYAATAGKPHARDAARHLVLFFRRLKKGEIKL